MPTKIEGRSTRHDLIDDIVEAPTSSSLLSNSISSFRMDGSKPLANRNFSSYSNIPTLFNNKPKLEQTDNPMRTSTSALTDEIRDRLNLTIPRSNSSSTMRNDERRKELDLVLKHLYDGKLLTTLNDDRASSDISEQSIPILSKGPTTTTTTTSTMKIADDNKMNVENIDVSFTAVSHIPNFGDAVSPAGDAGSSLNFGICNTTQVLLLDSFHKHRLNLDSMINLHSLFYAVRKARVSRNSF